ncbi:MAG TPA: thioredoxin family protein [Anaerolineaceae bacterium]
MAKILDEGILKQVQEVFAELNGEVRVVFFRSKENCDYCNETQQLLEEVISLSEKLSIEVFDIADDAAVAAQYGIDKTPAFVLAAKDGDQITDFGVRFSGIPAGHEFTSLINDLLIVSRRDSGLAPQTRSYLDELTEPLLLQVFVTPT